jgi:hypothetical protein
MAIYLSMQRVRFASADGYEKFKTVFKDVRNDLRKLFGFIHLTWRMHRMTRPGTMRSASGPASRCWTTGTWPLPQEFQDLGLS